MFNIGDKLIHPMHGAGVIDSIVSQKVDGETREYFVVRMICGSMEMKIPRNGCDIIGVRPVLSEDEIDGFLSEFASIETEFNQNWNKRFRENMVKIKSGDIFQVAEVIKSLVQREKERSLSTGERKLLTQAKQIVISEIMMIKGLEYMEIDSIMTGMVV